MNGDEIPHEKLSAYVDGELAPEDAAQIARRAASDPAVARQLAMLQSLRAEIAVIAPDVVVPELGRIGPSIGRRTEHEMPRLPQLAAAAVFFALLIGAGWLVGSQPQANASDPERNLAHLIESHDTWRDNPVPMHNVSAPVAPRITNLMAETGLQLVHEELLALPGNTTVRHSGYLGSNGCRLSLFEIAAPIRQAAAADTMLAFSQNEGLLQATWASGATRYIMLARDMDSVRFTTIASSIREALETTPDNDGDLITALAGARQRCLA
ncbi:anti-sigma factor family protein [Alkalilacustris brevis]|uniref:anti-sigma factor family protein n=1 Tax=Alkalilacustris brevis TaxID=2026338 RepID=UPI000E0CE266|nr:hypothetical protein [Alkalilacustris brevis]